MRRAGHEVRVVGPELTGRAAAAFAARMRRALPAWIAELLELAYNLTAYRRLGRAIKDWRPDVLYERYNLFTVAGVWAKRRYGLPYLLEVNAPLAEERQTFGRLAFRRLAARTERLAWRSADRVFPVTQVLAEILKEAGVPPERIVVIPNGVDPARFSDPPDPEACKRRLGEGRLVLGFVGYVRDWHGLDRVLDVLAEADPALRLHLAIAGEGPALPSLRRRAEELGLAERVSFLGAVPRAQVPEVIAAFDIALQPAVVPYASPLKLFEYMALGKAIVAPDQPNIREVLTDGKDAILFEPQDWAALGCAVLALCRDGDLRALLGQEARARVADGAYTWDENVRSVARAVPNLVCS